MQNTPIFEENAPDKFKGIDIMRAVRSFDPCLPCGVHMYLGDGQGTPQAAQPARLQRHVIDRPRGAVRSPRPGRGPGRCRQPMMCKPTGGRVEALL